METELIFTLTTAVSIGLVLLGLIAGIITGLFGAGGGFLVTPSLHILFNIPMHYAIGTCAVQRLGASIFALINYKSRKYLGIKIAGFLGIGIIPGSYLGAGIVTHLKSEEWYSPVSPSVSSDFILLSILLFFLSVVLIWLLVENYILQKKKDGMIHRGYFANFRIPPIIQVKTIHSQEFSASILIVIGFGLGFISGLLGIGSGIFTMPILHFLIGQKTKDAVYTSLMVVFLAGFSSTLMHGIMNNIEFRVAILLICGTLFGTYFGKKLNDRLSDKSIRKYFSLIIGAALLIVLIKIISQI